MVKEKYILDLKQYGLLEKHLFSLMFIFHLNSEKGG